MLGAIIGDIAGSRFEFRNHRSKDFDIFHSACFFTDDTVMTCAVADCLVNNGKPEDLKHGFLVIIQNHTILLVTERLCVFLLQDGLLKTKRK